MLIENMVPDIYCRESRDFSYVARVFELVFNYLKTNSDAANVNLTDKHISRDVLDLYANMLGFEPRHVYDQTDLHYILLGFTELIKTKGSLQSIETALQLLFNAQKITNNNLASLIDISLNDDSDPYSRYNLRINIPSDFKDIVLLEDLFDYILPAGFTYKFELLQSSIPELSSDIKVGTFMSDYDDLLKKIKQEDTVQIRITNSDMLNTDDEDVISHIGYINTGVLFNNNFKGSDGPKPENTTDLNSTDE